MRRIGLAVVITLNLLLAPLAVDAQAGKVWRIGYLGNFPFVPSNSFLRVAFTDGLREYGYVEGKNLTIEFRFADGREERYPELVRELLQANVELVVTVQTRAALALKQEALALPVVLLGSGNPVEAGLVQSLARPGGNITGLSNQTWTASLFSSRGSSSRGCRVSAFYGIPPITPRHSASTPCKR